MCLIIQRPAEKILDFDKFKTAVENNPDGFGVSVVNGDGTLLTARDHRKPDIDKLYNLIQGELLDKHLLIHLRYTTAGKTNLRNAHPFPVLERAVDGVDLRMAHNGTLFDYKTNTGESDSRKFVRGFVRPLFKRLIKGYTIEQILKDPFVEWVLDKELSKSSVLSFVDGFGNTLNVNAKGNGGFYDDDGVYFSNTYSFDPKHRTPVTSYFMNGYPNNYYNNVPKKSNVVTYKPSTDKHASDTMTQRFSEKYELSNFDEVLTLDDAAIKELVTTSPNDATLLIKELLDEYYQLTLKKDRV